jgi:hypothetical protein
MSFSRFLEPLVLITGVINDKIHDELHPSAVHLGYETVNVGERAELRMDRLVVGDVVAIVDEWGSIDRRQPDSILHVSLKSS